MEYDRLVKEAFKAREIGEENDNFKRLIINVKTNVK